MTTTVIARRARVAGKIDADGDLLVEGRVEGSIRAAGRVAVAASGVVLAEIRARAAEIAGVVVGDVLVEERIDVLAGARVVGDLRAPAVAIAAGATIEGQVDRMPPPEPEPAAAAETRVAVKPRGSLARPKPPARVRAGTAPERPRPPARPATAPPALPRLPQRARVRPR